jgi:hypothetical protein
MKKVVWYTAVFRIRIQIGSGFKSGQWIRIQIRIQIGSEFRSGQWIRIQSGKWIRIRIRDPDPYSESGSVFGIRIWIRIRIRNHDPNPDPGGQKLPRKVEFFIEISCCEVLDILF